jgi:hypothetical protein
MRRLLTLGFFFSLAGALGTGCGDDESSNANGGSSGRGGSAGSGGGGGRGGTAGTAGTGGTAGTAGTGGTAGTAGTGGSAGSAGSAGTAGNAGSAGSGDDNPDAGGDAGGPPCTSCVELRVPVNGDGTTTLDDFQSVGFQFAGSFDLSNATVTFRVRALTIDDQLTASPYVVDRQKVGEAEANGFDFVNSFEILNAGNGFTDEDTWVNLTFDVGSLPDPPQLSVTDAGVDAGTTQDLDAFDNSDVLSIGIQVGSAGSFAGAETVTILIDSVTFTGVDSVARPNVSFDTSLEGFGFGFASPDTIDPEIILHAAE